MPAASVAEQYTLLHPSNQVDGLVAAEFGAPELWNRDGAPGSFPERFGMSFQPSGRNHHETYQLGEPERAWWASIYGSRLLLNGSGYVIVETTDVGTLHRIHQRLDETVMAGEHMHVATPTMPPEPRNGSFSLANNRLWLEKIAYRRQWPIMAENKPIDGLPVHYSRHDRNDWHLGNFASYPLEGQDLVARVAGTELAVIDDKGPDTVLLPRRVRHNQPTDRFTGGFSGYYLTGIQKIDDFSDDPHYVRLLDYALSSDVAGSPEERIAHLVETTEENPENLHWLMVGCLPEVRRQLGSLLNFITIYERGRTTTDDMVDQLMSDFLQGTARMAHKILGSYVPKPNQSITYV